MSSKLVNFAKDVKQERIDVEVQRLVVEKELGDQAQVLCVDLVLLAVDLVDRKRPLAVNLFTRRLPQNTVRLQIK